MGAGEGGCACQPPTFKAPYLRSLFWRSLCQPAVANSCHWLETSSIFNFIHLLYKNQHGFVCLLILSGPPLHAGPSGAGPSSDPTWPILRVGDGRARETEAAERRRTLGRLTIEIREGRSRERAPLNSVLIDNPGFRVCSSPPCSRSALSNRNLTGATK